MGFLWLPRHIKRRQNPLEQADILVGLVDHDEFKLLNADQLQEKIVIDTRGMW